MDVAAYLERIGYCGSVAATLATLRQIHERHPAAIPFENLDAFSGSTASLEIESIEQKLEIEFLLQAAVQEGWKSLYRFDLQPQTCTDYGLTNWYLSNHPDSHFRKHLVVARAAPERRYALLDERLTLHYNDGASERRVVSSVVELRQVLCEIFLLRLSESPTLAGALERVLPSGA